MSDTDSDDEGSLFGDSPPPTRASSPSLALPTAVTNIGIPLAPHKAFPYQAYFPTAAAGAQQSNYYCPPPAAPQVPTRRAPLAPVPAECTKPTTVSIPPKKKQKKEKRQGPRPPPPQIRLPDPDAPPPVNFLRNQKALLGTAGLVGRVKPSKLSIERHQRGTTLGNPINVDDEDDAPAISFRALPVSSLYAEAPKPTTPSNEEIVASLIRQKNIFPILQSLLQLLAKSEAPSFEEPSAKRQKTDKEQSYHTNWEQQRGKQLIAQLVGLIKTAATRAAAKTYNDSQQARRDQERRAYTPQPQYYSRLDPVTGMYRTEYVVDYRTMYQQQAPSLFPAPAPSPSPTAAPSPSPAPQQSFDTLVASLLAGTSGDAPTTPLVDLEIKAASPQPEEVDQSMVSSWMSILRTYPNSCFTPSIDDITIDPSLRSAASTPTAIGSPMHSSASTPGPDGTEPSMNKGPDQIAAAAARLLAQTQVKTASAQPKAVPTPATAGYPRYMPIPGVNYMPPGAYYAPHPYYPMAPGQQPPPGYFTAPAPHPHPHPNPNQQQLQSSAPYFPYAAAPGQTPSYAMMMYARPPYYMHPQAFPQTAQQRPPTSAPVTVLNPQETLRKAKERKRQLLWEIERTKVEMWETTVEQGVLTQLLKGPLDSSEIVCIE